jgi:hypothetical protein
VESDNAEAIYYAGIGVIIVNLRVTGSMVGMFFEEE